MIRIELNAANIEHNHFYLAKHLDAFPNDTLGGTNRAAAANRRLTLHWPFGEPVTTDIAGGHKFFRKRGWIRTLFAQSGAEPGDFVVLKPVSPYEYEVQIEKTVRMTTQQFQSVGQTIQVQIKTAAWITRAKFEIAPAYQGFFPADALGARGVPEQDRYPVRGTSVEFDYGLAGTSRCDIATKSNGVMRPRESGPVRRFYEAHRIEVDDVLLITRLDERRYKVEVVR